MDTAALCSNALCVGLDVHIFVPNTDDVRARSRAITNPPPFVLETCQQVCPVRGACLHYGIESGSSGWWGGFLLHHGGPVVAPAIRIVPAPRIDRRRGHPGTSRANATKHGLGRMFFDAALSSATDECILWPFGTSPRPMLHLDGHNRHVTALVAIAVHGPRPSRSHFSYQSCGRTLCINPRHITWRKGQSTMQKLDADKVRQIRRLHAEGTTLTALARLFGVALQSVSNVVHRITWSEVE